MGLVTRDPTGNREWRCTGGTWLLKGFGIPVITGSLLPPNTGNYVFPVKSCRPGEPVRATTLSFHLYHFVVQLEKPRSCALP